MFCSCGIVSFGQRKGYQDDINSCEIGVLSRARIQIILGLVLSSIMPEDETAWPWTIVIMVVVGLGQSADATRGCPVWYLRYPS